MGEKYDYGIDFGRVEAIDVHTHVEVDCHAHQAYDDVLVAATAAYFRMTPPLLAGVERLADHYRQRTPRRWCSPSTPATDGGRTNSVEDLIAGAAPRSTMR